MEPAAGAERPGAGSARRLALDRLSRSELEVLQQLAERRAELDERARQLDRHAALLATAEANLAAQLERLEQLRGEIAAMVAAHDAAEEAKLTALVKIYESMKPKAAAEIFNRLELPTLISVLERMRAAKSADVLARMDPAKARHVTPSWPGAPNDCATRQAADPQLDLGNESRGTDRNIRSGG